MLNLLLAVSFILSFPSLLAYSTAGDAANAHILGLNMDTWMILTVIFLGVSSLIFVRLWFNIAKQGK